MNYNEIKKEYDVALKEQVQTYREISRLDKELGRLNSVYDEIESSFQTQLVNDKAKELERYRKSRTDPIEAKLMETEKRLADEKTQYEDKRKDITYDNLLLSCSSKQDIIEDVRSATDTLGEQLQHIVGSRFYSELLKHFDSKELEFDDEGLQEVINYFNKSETVIEKMQSGGGVVESAFDQIEQAIVPDEAAEEGDNSNKSLSFLIAIGVGVGLIVFTKITLPIYVVMLTIYGAYNIVRNMRVYKIMLVQKAVQDNINHIDELLKKQIADEVERQQKELDAAYLPTIDKLAKAVSQLKEDVVNASAEADSSFIYNSSKINDLKQIELEKNDKRKSALLTQKKQQEEVLEQKTKIVTELNKQLNELLNGLQDQYLHGVGKEVIFEPHFLFDIDTAKNRPVLFTHPQTSCLFLYDSVSDVESFIRLLIVQLRAKLNPFSLSITVADTQTAGQSFIYFMPDAENVNTQALFSILTDDATIKSNLDSCATELRKRQTNILREFSTIENYNNKMLELKSLTESYKFIFYLNPEASVLQDANMIQLLKIGGDLGMYAHLFIQKDNFVNLKAAADSVLSNVSKAYYLENGALYERAKDFINDTLLHADEQ